MRALTETKYAVRTRRKATRITPAPAEYPEALRDLYEREINVSISCFWDQGWNVKIGDPLNGYSAERDFSPKEFGEIGDWILAHADDQRSGSPPVVPLFKP